MPEDTPATDPYTTYGAVAACGAAMVGAMKWLAGESKVARAEQIKHLCEQNAALIDQCSRDRESHKAEIVEIAKSIESSSNRTSDSIKALAAAHEHSTERIVGKIDEQNGRTFKLLEQLTALQVTREARERREQT